jgi:hypothetical protein
MKMKVREQKYLNIDDYGRIHVHGSPGECFNAARGNEDCYWSIAKPHTIEVIVEVDMPQGLVTL